jgi:ribosomal protein S18 acetylase RimI-like enzyme
MSRRRDIQIRPFREDDRAFYKAIMPRFVPAQVPPTRDPVALARYLDQHAAGERAYPADTELFIAVDSAGQSVGLIAIRPDREHFSGQAQAYIELLAVTEAAEGTGVGRALMAHADRSASERGLAQITLDVFATNSGAIAFYQRAGYQPDSIRMGRSLRGSAPALDAGGRFQSGEPG